jgi:hypothetical protein
LGAFAAARACRAAGRRRSLAGYRLSHSRCNARFGVASPTAVRRTHPGAPPPPPYEISSYLPPAGQAKHQQKPYNLWPAAGVRQSCPASVSVMADAAPPKRSLIWRSGARSCSCWSRARLSWRTLSAPQREEPRARRWPRSHRLGPRFEQFKGGARVGRNLTTTRNLDNDLATAGWQKPSRAASTSSTCPWWRGQGQS